MVYSTFPSNEEIADMKSHLLAEMVIDLCRPQTQITDKAKQDAYRFMIHAALRLALRHDRIVKILRDVVLD